MAKKKQEEPPKGSPAWMATFSDLMNLLLCFFVLLFSMSTVDAKKFEMVVQSFQETFSVLPAGGTTIGEGEMINSGINMMEQFDMYINNSTGAKGDQDQKEQLPKEEEVKEAAEAQAEAESEKMSEQIEQQLAAYGLQNLVDVQFNAQYVELTLNGALLFESGDADVKSEALPIIEKIAVILGTYTQNTIDIEGHTDSIPYTGGIYANNNVLSMFRALNVSDKIRQMTDIPDANIKSSGRGDYVPIADNSTPEGRARNRRVEIKIYNSYSSDVQQ